MVNIIRYLCSCINHHPKKFICNFSVDAGAWHGHTRSTVSLWWWPMKEMKVVVAPVSDFFLSSFASFPGIGER